MRITDLPRNINELKAEHRKAVKDIINPGRTTSQGFFVLVKYLILFQ